jgi:hypothetical protein
VSGTMNDPTNPEYLQNITQQLIKAITSPQVMEQMRQFREKAAAGATHSEAGDLMSLETLKAAGAQLPSGFRITSRVFEDKASRRIIDLDPGPSKPALRQNASGVSGCAGGGAATVCGCAGGGT